MLVIDKNMDEFYSHIRADIFFLTLVQNQKAISEKRDNFDDITQLHGKIQ